MATKEKKERAADAAQGRQGEQEEGRRRAEGARSARGRRQAGAGAAAARVLRRNGARAADGAVRPHEPAPGADAREDRAQRRRRARRSSSRSSSTTVVEELATITGQQPVRRKAKKSIANFGLREGQEIGASVTLRGARMWEFLDRFVTVALPRVRDFRGVGTRSFDGRGQLLARREGADDLPGDQLRHDRARSTGWTSRS